MTPQPAREPEAAGLLGWLIGKLPYGVRERCFLPSFYDLQSEYAGAPRSSWRRVAFRVRVWATLVECLLRSAGPRRRRRGVDPMLLHDLRFAVRVLVKRRGFTAVALAAIAIGIGANTAIFSVIHAVLLRPLPYGEPSRIVRVYESARGALQAVAPPNYIDWVARTRTFESMAAFQQSAMTFDGATPERVDAGFVGARLFEVLGVPPLLGRVFAPLDEREGGPRVVVLGHTFWQQRFGGDPSIVGRGLRFDGRDYEVIGVMPRGFTFPGDVDLWFPLRLNDGDTNDNQRGAHYLEVVARLKPGVTVEHSIDDLASIERSIAERFANVQGYGVHVEPLLDAMVGDVRRPLLVLLGAVAFVLLIACANVSNLLLAQAASRRAEIGLRAALGASRWRIVRQLLAESAVLAIAGGVLGILLANWGVRVLSAVVPQDLPRAGSIAVNGWALAFTASVSLAAGLVFGIAPAIYASMPGLSASLKDGRRDGRSPGASRRFLGGLVAAEIALALILLAGAGLALRSFVRLNDVNPGFDATNVLQMTVALPDVKYPDVAAVAAFYRQFLDRVSGQPGVISAGAVMSPPLSGNRFGGSFSIIGRTGGDTPRMQVRPATPGYFETLRIPLRRGRTILESDGRGSANVVVISEETARKYWPGEDPIGKRIRIHVALGVPEREREIVGVVGDVKIRTLDAAAVPVAYVPHAQYVSDQMTIVVRGAGDPMALLPFVRTQLAQLDREIALTDVGPATQLAAKAVAQPRFRTIVLSLFASVALALAAVGLYGVTAYSVSQRRAELGVRMALGAESRQVVRLVLREGLMPVAVGIAVGIAGAAILTRVISTLLFDVAALDPLTFATVPVLLAIVAIAACYLPARRASTVDPLTVLRE